MNEEPSNRLPPDQFLAQIDSALKSLTEDQLHMLHKKVAERIRLLHGHTQSRVLQHFQLGDKVSFTDHRTNIRIVGTVIRLNQKTATVAIEGGHRWRVSPSLLTKAE